MFEVITQRNNWLEPFLNESLEASLWRPAVDLYETVQNFTVKADLPGLDKNDIDISVHGDTLYIKGEKKAETEVKEREYIKTERVFGAFSRAILLPSGVDANNIKASYKNGVLELTIPKKEEAKPKQIKIES